MVAGWPSRDCIEPPGDPLRILARILLHNLQRRRLPGVASFVFAQAALLFGCAGRLDWWGAWAYLTVYVGIILLLATWLLPRDPGQEPNEPRSGPALRTLGYLLFAWAMLSNPFFSAVVRIQTDRGHRVASGGPYHFVRDPAYAGMVGFVLATPVLLDSWSAMIPSVALAVLVVVRTILEDRTLTRELPGYAEYSSQVRYRLFPGFW